MPAGAGPSPSVLVYGDARLRRPGRPVVEFDELTQQLADHLWATLRTRGGVGLAAPQIGADSRLVVIRDPRAQGRGGRLALANPVLQDQGGGLVDFQEGCLSFPGLYLWLRRAAVIEIGYQDLRGQSQRLAAGGLLARVIQHEIDHLDGILFIDHLSWWRRLVVGGRLRRLACGARGDRQ